jgi:hypothetical protein
MILNYTLALISFVLFMDEDRKCSRNERLFIFFDFFSCVHKYMSEIDLHKMLDENRYQSSKFHLCVVKRITNYIVFLL